MNRKIEDLTPETQKKYWAFDSKMKEAGIDYIVTCTRRTEVEQAELYAQGRTKPGKIVTWTLKGNHINGTAFDVAILENDKIDWDIANPKWSQAGRIGESVGLKWGIIVKGKRRDFPHFENVEG